MIEKRIFPNGNGIYFNTAVTETDTGVKIAGFDCTVSDKTYSIASGEFTLAVGDTIYVTPDGLKQCTKNEQPTSRFPNGSAYWLVSKFENEILVLEVQ